MIEKVKIAIIGAGISGVVLAQNLQKHFEIEVFEKSRGCGGRMSTRHAEDFSFDHGVQFFTAKNAEFRNFLNPFFKDKTVRFWTGKEATFKDKGFFLNSVDAQDRIISSPKMNSLCKKIAQNSSIKFGVEVLPIKKDGEKSWRLKDIKGNDLGVFDFVISTAPPIQTENLFGDNLPKINQLQKSLMKPCFALMLGLNSKWEQDWNFAKIENNPIKKIFVNSSKSERNSDVTSLVIHAQEDWSESYLENDLDLVKNLLVKNLEKFIKIIPSEIAYLSLHRWRYALIDKAQKSEIFFDKNLNIAATSDWVCGSKIENVWLAAGELSQKIITNFGKSSS